MDNDKDFVEQPESEVQKKPLNYFCTGFKRSEAVN